MANLLKLQQFAAANDFDLTKPLIHEQVSRLAKAWAPDMRFHTDERFHPISLGEAFSMAETLFGSLPANEKEQWRVRKFVRAGANAGIVRTFDPPVVHVPDGVVLSGQTIRPLVRVLNDGSSGRAALSLTEVDGDAVITHGASFDRSNKFFGGTQPEDDDSSAADLFLPRAVGADGLPRVTVLAALVNLLDLLKYELLVSGDDDYPPDGLRRGFEIVGSLLHGVPGQAVPLSDDQLREILLGFIASHESGGAIPAPTLPLGWRLDRVAWDAVTRFAFLEYSFFYAYNDFDRYQTTPFENEHEGDDEGCCLVFDRNVLNLAASGDPDALLRAVPHSIITSVHEEYQDADLFKFIPPPSPGDPNAPARDSVPFRVYVAGGSHATYLTPGNHDLVDFGDSVGVIEEHPELLLIAPITLALVIIIAIIEHFVDTEDFMSDDGVHSGPGEDVGSDPAAVTQRVIVMPMSADNHIYQPQNEELLRLRAYAGKWGGHDGPFDVSPEFVTKTGRYFRKLLDSL